MIARRLVPVDSIDRLGHWVVALFATSLLAGAFMALGGCSASGGGEGGTPAGSGQPAATVTSITLSPTGASLQVGQSQQFTATAKDVNGSTIPGVPFTWTSSESLVASVSSSGLVTGLAEGGTSIRAAAGGILSAPATVSVSVAPPVVTAITLSPTGASLQVGQSQQFAATAKDANGNTISGVGFTWQSSNAAVAGVSGSGLASGVSAGSTTITASAGGVTSGGASLTVTGGGGGVSNSYTTSFPLTETPISEGGRWLNGKADGIDWMNIRTASGVAYGTRTNEPGDAIDPTAILAGTWGWNQTAEAVLVVNSVSASKEVELRLNSSLSAHVCSGYEVLYEIAGTISIVRWNGPLGDFTFLTPATDIAQALPGGLKSGDVIKATNVNGLITAYLNGNPIAQVFDATFTAGAPGFGLNTYGGVDPTTYGLSRFTASSN